LVAKDEELKDVERREREDGRKLAYVQFVG